MKSATSSHECELAVQGANGDLTSTDRSYIDTEFGLLKDEITRNSRRPLNSTEKSYSRERLQTSPFRLVSIHRPTTASAFPSEAYLYRALA